jgi:hypothetical protein
MKISFTPVELDGITGNLSLVPGKNLINTLDSNLPFTPGISSKIGTFSLRGSKDSPLTLGNNSTLSIEVSADLEWSLNIAWKEEDLPEKLQKSLKIPLSAENFILYTTASFTSVNSVDTKCPFYSYLSAQAGAKSDALLCYHAAMIFQKTSKSMDALNSFIASIHLPTNLSKAVTPLPSLQSLRTRGSLSLSTSLTLGYAIKAQKSLNEKLPALVTKGSLSMHAAASMKIGGCFTLTTQSGSKPNWINIRYRHGKELHNNLQWGIDAGAQITLEDIDSTQGLLDKLTGINPENAFDWLNTYSEGKTKEEALSLVESKYSDEISKIFGGLIDNLFQNKNFQEISDECALISKKYNELKSILNEGALKWLWETLKKESPEKISKDLNAIKVLKNSKALQQLQDTKLWEIIESITGVTPYELLTDPKKIAELIKVSGILLQLLGGNALDLQLKSFILGTLQRLDINKLLNLIQDISSPSELQELFKGVEGTLCKLLFNLSEKIISDKVFQETQKAVKELIGFSTKLTECLKNGFSNQLKLDLVRSIGNSSSDEAFIDVDVNLSTIEGRTIAQQLLEGKIDDSLPIQVEPNIQWNDCIWKSTHKRTSTININLLGWSYSCKSIVEQSSQTQITPNTEGNIYLYKSNSTLQIHTEHGFRNKSAIDSVYGLQFSAKSQPEKQEEIIDSPTLCNSYKLITSDAGITVNELEQQLVFGKQLGMFPSVDAPLNAWLKDWGSKLPQSASLTYTVKYSEGSFYETLARLGQNELINRSRSAIREFFSYPYRHGNSFISSKELKAYMECDCVKNAERGGGHNKFTVTIIQKNGVTLMSIPNANSRVLQAFKSEKDFLKEICNLSVILKEKTNTEAQIYVDNVNKAIRDLLQVPQEYTQTVWCNNLFFLIVDALQLASFPGSREGKCMLQADFSFQDGKETTHFYTC